MVNHDPYDSIRSVWRSKGVKLPVRPSRRTRVERYLDCSCVATLSISSPLSLSFLRKSISEKANKQQKKKKKARVWKEQATRLERSHHLALKLRPKESDKTNEVSEALSVARTVRTQKSAYEPIGKCHKIASQLLVALGRLAKPVSGHNLFLIRPKRYTLKTIAKLADMMREGKVDP